MAKDLDNQIHQEILDNPEADKAASEIIVERLVSRGMDRDEAEALFGYKPTPIYYLKEEDILYRRDDGTTGFMPNQILRSTGWGPIRSSLSVSEDEIPGGGPAGGINNQADPLLMTKLSRITLHEALRVAVGRGLPTTGWEETDG